MMKSLLQKAGIMNIAIDSAQVLTIKAGLAIPEIKHYTKLSKYITDLAGEERMCHTCRLIVTT